MKKLILLLPLIMLAFVLACENSNSKKSFSGSPKMVLDSSKASTSASVVSRSAAKSVVNNALTADISGLYVSSIDAMAFAYEPGGATHTRNFTYPYDKGDISSTWSTYAFCVGASDKVVQAGDIQDLSTFARADGLMSEAFNTDYYNNSTAFNMDIVMVKILNPGIIHKEATTSVDVPQNYCVYGNVWPAPQLSDATHAWYEDILYKYPQYTVPLVTRPNSTTLDLDSRYRVASLLSTKDNNEGLNEGFTVMFINSSLCPDLTQPTWFVTRTTDWVSWKAAKLGADGLLHFIDDLGTLSNETSGATIDLMTSLFNDKTIFPNTGNTLSWATGSVLVIPYASKSIAMAKGVADGANVFANPKLSVTFDLSDVLDVANITWYNGFGTLYKPDYVTHAIPLKSDVFNGVLPFNLKIAMTDQVTETTTTE